MDVVWNRIFEIFDCIVNCIIKILRIVMNYVDICVYIMGKLKFIFVLNENFLGRYVLWRYFIFKLNVVIFWILCWMDLNDWLRRFRIYIVWIVFGVVMCFFYRFLLWKFFVYCWFFLFLIMRKINLVLILSDGCECKVLWFWKMFLIVKLCDFLCWLIFVYYVLSVILIYINLRF